ncbi:hypothetical protein [Xenorhabdus bovienii]|uniref:hypothetical protein n=1 Tax=Xenorhabdus bovienii TaxID=40576 RepID=UPI0023B263D5|nr:hypothetical protein [Xenorhabdus bovienii]MDE9487547.1 hypothetical protein [Xenorhabdus bovienii]
MTFQIKDRGITLTDEQMNALEHLKKVALRKNFYAEFVANLYNDVFKCDISACARYLAGETAGDNRLKQAFNLMLCLASQGIGSHEYLGEKFVRTLIKQYKLSS